MSLIENFIENHEIKFEGKMPHDAIIEELTQINDDYIKKLINRTSK